MFSQWIKICRNDYVSEIIRCRHNELALIMFIGQEAEFTPDQFGKAWIGDYEAVGLSRQQYRTALKMLEDSGAITVTKTNAGTVATIINGVFFDISTPPWYKIETGNNHPLQPPKRTRPLAHRVIDYLNAVAGKRFTYTQGNLKNIRARIRENFKPEDFKHVVDAKVSQWSGDPQLEKYIRPQTLFSEKFDSYLNEAKSISKKEPWE